MCSQLRRCNVCLWGTRIAPAVGDPYFAIGRREGTKSGGARIGFEDTSFTSRHGTCSRGSWSTEPRALPVRFVVRRETRGASIESLTWSLEVGLN